MPGLKGVVYLAPAPAPASLHTAHCKRHKAQGASVDRKSKRRWRCWQAWNYRRRHGEPNSLNFIPICQCRAERELFTFGTGLHYPAPSLSLSALRFSKFQVLFGYFGLCVVCSACCCQDIHSLHQCSLCVVPLLQLHMNRTDLCVRLPCVRA